MFQLSYTPIIVYVEKYNYMADICFVIILICLLKKCSYIKLKSKYGLKIKKILVTNQRKNTR